MDLSPERKQEIEEEERQRHAEEQYRAELRAKFAAAPPAQATAAPPAVRDPGRSNARWIVGVVLLLAVVAVVVVNSNTRHVVGAGSSSSAAAAPVPSVRYVPATDKIASGQIVVRASGFVQYRIQITREMRNAHVSGTYNASGGSGNDITAVIATESEFANWINGHQARVYYGSEGKKTTDSFDVRLGPGSYILGFSNRFSAFSSKDVFLDVTLNYDRLETY